MYRKKLLELGIPPHFSGFEYLNYAICVHTPTQRMMDLYRAVAEEYGISTSRAERSMRYAISKTDRIITTGEFVARYSTLWGDGNAD